MQKWRKPVGSQNLTNFKIKKGFPELPFRPSSGLAGPTKQRLPGRNL